MTDNIKLPPMPRPQLEKAGWTFYDDSDMENYAREAVRLNAQAVPDGWVLVPVEATLDMLDAFRNHDDSVLGPDFLGAYRAMLSAAPAAPQADAKPMFWVRLCSDGCYEGPIHDSSIEDVRKQSGAWHPLYLAAPAAPQPAQPLTDEKDALLRQALEALENGARVRNADGGTKYQPPIEEAAIKAIRNHLGVKSD